MLKTASMAPAAPRQWPVITFVELTLTLALSSPKKFLKAVISALSFLPVPVP